ncbi:ABC transporter permease [Cytobacillus sp. FJAT-54145]|uniref:Transport permease protein n=1 Tax=Cytobacillus spartinae TaxID=3299023 RepID=A0ABW6KH16_9BACI
MMSIIFRSMIITSLRDKITLFYSLLFPIVLMVGLGLYFEGGDMPIRIVSGVTAISTIFWGMQGIAFQVHLQRNRGVYKLLKLTPMPILSFIFIMTLARTLIGTILNMLVWVGGILFLGIEVGAGAIFISAILIAVGSLCFTAIGFLIANLAQNEGQINMYSNLLQLPMIFMSQAFYPLTNAPQWVSIVGKLLPFEYYVQGLRGTLTESHGDLFLAFLIPCLYLIGSMLLAVPTFKWDPHGVKTINRVKKYST